MGRRRLLTLRAGIIVRGLAHQAFQQARAAILLDGFDRLADVAAILDDGFQVGRKPRLRPRTRNDHRHLDPFHIRHTALAFERGRELWLDAVVQRLFENVHRARTRNADER